jgi:dihydrofolate synthase/folylpolyglutamate synthase
MVAANLGLLEYTYQVITVAGTNGKGSCIAFLENMITAADQGKVGSYTSPHLIRYNERIRVDGDSVDDELICLAFEDIEKLRGNVSLTYFEYGTLAALWIFKRQKIDIALLEVGLGGRLDAVNIVDADVAVITSIDIDHQDWLGESREAIGVEKAGVARPGRPVICGDLAPPENMLLALEHTGADVYLLGSKEFKYILRGSELDLQCVDSAGGQAIYSGLPLPQLPLGSAVCAVQALVCANRSPSQNAVVQAYRETCLAGRFQQIRFAERDIIIDVAHNPAAALLLADRLVKKLADKSGGASTGSVYGLFGVLASKDFAGMIAALLGVINYWHVCDLKDVPDSASAINLSTSLEEFGLPAEQHESVASGVLSIVENMGENDILIIFGSFYTVAQVLVLVDTT